MDEMAGPKVSFIQMRVNLDLPIPKIPGLADNPRIEHAQTWNLLNPSVVLLIPKIPGLGMYDSILRFSSS